MPGEEAVRNARRLVPAAGDVAWRKHVHTAWQAHPHVAAMLALRLDAAFPYVAERVRRDPAAVADLVRPCCSRVVTTGL